MLTSFVFFLFAGQYVDPLNGIRQNRIEREKIEKERQRLQDEAREKERAKRRRKIPKIIITDYDEEMRQLKSSLSSFKSETSEGSVEQLKIKLDIPICSTDETDYPHHPSSDDGELDSTPIPEPAQTPSPVPSIVVENTSVDNGGEDSVDGHTEMSLLAPPSMSSLAHDGIVLGEGGPELADDTGIYIS